MTATLDQHYNFLNPPAPHFIDGIICQTSSIAANCVVVGGTADGSCALPSGADTSAAVIGVTALAGAANATSPVKLYIGGLVQVVASGTITRFNQLTVASTAGDVHAVSASTPENATVVGIAFMSATNGQTFYMLLMPEMGSVGSQTADITPFHSVRGVCTTNQSVSAFASVSGGTIVDGVTYAANDRVLLAGQSTASQNGVYSVGTVASGTAPLTRVVDMPTSSTLPAATYVGVSEGTANANTLWRQATAGSALVVGTSSITFAPLASSQSAPVHTVRGVCWTNQSTTAFASVTGGTIIDGVTYAIGQRVLLAGQSTASQNGVWVVGVVATGTAPLSRPADFATGQLMPPATTVLVSEGTTMAGSIWRSQTALGSGLTIDTTSINFGQIFDAGQGVNPKVRVVGVANVTLSTGLVAGQTIDSVTLVAGDRVLLVNQSTASQNGIYVATVSGTGAYAPDWVQGAVKAAQVIEVSEGTVWANSTWKATAAAVAGAGGYYTVGTTDPVFYPKNQIGSTAVGTAVTTAFVKASTAGIAMNDITSAAAVKCILGAGRGNGTITFTGTGTDTIQFCVTNW